MDDPCAQCGHEFGPHELIGGDDPLDGGIVLCQEGDCDCISTWGIKEPEPKLVYWLLQQAVLDHARRARMEKRLKVDH